MSSAPKRRRIEEKGSATESASIDKVAPFISVGCSDGNDLMVQQAKKYAMTQAQQEGCLGNYRSVDSRFGNYLVPVIPTRTDLYRYVTKLPFDKVSCSIPVGHSAGMRLIVQQTKKFCSNKSATRRFGSQYENYLHPLTSKFVLYFGGISELHLM